MDILLDKLRLDFPALNIIEGDTFCWSPHDQVVYYAPARKRTDAWTLLHEASHGILQHTTFTSDFELLRLEMAAWEKAKQLAARYKLQISDDHIEDCLDTYRDWLHKRSLCPSCDVKSLQIDSSTYGCINCKTNWRVSNSRLCRPYRTKLQVN
jgi:hypothetical protein